MSAPAIRAAHLAFAHGDAVPLFEEVSFHIIGPGWWGLVGENGAGKTTLLRLVAGLLDPAAGAIAIEPDQARVALCEQAVDRPPDGATELAASDGAAIRLRARLRLEPAELARWDTLSPGERKRWQIGAALLAEPDLLLLDEPTNHLDDDGRALLVGALRRHRGAGVVVSHDRALLDELTRGTLRIRGTGVGALPLPYAQARAASSGSRRRWPATRERCSWSRMTPGSPARWSAAPGGSRAARSPKRRPDGYAGRA